jgi:hypothetical protein
MFYVILGIVVIVALLLIFRDDKDGSYNRSEKGHKKEQSHKYTGAGTKAEAASTSIEPKAEEKTVRTSVKEILGEIEEALIEARKGFEEPVNEVEESLEEEMDLTFLDDIEYSDDLDEDTETFDVTGLRYHCTVYDCGKIVGVVVPEPSNVHDSRAQAVIRNDGKLLGYIPRSQLDWYEDFNEDNVSCPFVGEIGLDNSTSRLVAEIKVILPSSREFVEEEIEEDL